MKLGLTEEEKKDPIKSSLFYMYERLGDFFVGVCEKQPGLSDEFWSLAEQFYPDKKKELQNLEQTFDYVIANSDINQLKQNIVRYENGLRELIKIVAVRHKAGEGKKAGAGELQRSVPQGNSDGGRDSTPNQRRRLGSKLQT